MSSPNKRVALARFEFAELCEHPDFRGRWVALDNVCYDAVTSKPAEGDVVDADTDLAALCARMRAAAQRACAIVRCVGPGVGEAAPVSRMSGVPSSRMMRAAL